MQCEIVFLDVNNRTSYLEEVTNWLEDDFTNKKSPSNHFWHNINMIENSFHQCKAMITLDNNKNVIAFMTWDIIDGHEAEIGIVEVKETHRRKHVFKSMLSDFLHQHKEVIILVVRAVEQAEHVFEAAGWKNKIDINRVKKYYKIVKPTVEALSDLPKYGFAVAVCSENGCLVASDPTPYEALTKYFPITLDKKEKLITPIVTDFYYNGYIGVYFDGKLICHSKAKHLFNNETTEIYLNLFILGSIEPQVPELYDALYNQSTLKPKAELE